jgi:AcrR family transcriptional regulator
MPETVNPRREYDSTRRRELAKLTRRAILEAARQLFLENGYVATTIDAIADHADVSVETVYAIFKNKRTLLSDVLDVSMAGDDEPVPIMERAWVQELRNEPDPRKRVRMLARNGRLILERVTPLYEVLRGAASADPAIASLWELNKSQRFAGQSELVRIVGANSALREGLTKKQAADIVFAIGSPETYRSLVTDRGWSAQRFENWYGDTLGKLLLELE